MNKRYKFVTIIIAVGILVAIGAWRWSASNSGSGGSKQLRVAVLLPLTGPAASTGEGAKRGMELALDEIKKQGGSISLEYLDTQANPKTAVSVYQQLMAKTPPDVVIMAMSGVTAAIKPVLTGDVLAVATCVADTRLSDPSDQSRLFRVFLGADGMGETAAKHISGSGAKKTAVVYINDDYGRSVAESFKKHYLELPQNSIIEESFGLMDKDFRTSWSKLLQSKPDAVFVAGYGPGYFTVLNQLRETDYQGLIVTDWSLTDPVYIKATNGVRNGTKVVAVQWSPEFETSYREKYGETGSFVLSGYAHASLEMVWQAYSSSDKSVPDLAKKFSELRDSETAMGRIRILPTGGVSADYTIFTLKDMNLIK